MTLVNRAVISDSSAYHLCILLDDLTSCFFAPTTPSVSEVSELEYNRVGGERRRDGRVDIRGGDEDGGGPRCENARYDGFWTSSRLAVFVSSTRSLSSPLHRVAFFLFFESAGLQLQSLLE